MARRPETTGSKQAETQFKPGASGNPKGRPKGSKHKFAEDFWRDLQEAWAEKGASVIKSVIAEDPAKFLVVASNMLPKEVEITNKDFVIIVPAVADSVDEWLSQHERTTTATMQ